ncbi:MAG: hypothetical protein BWY35_01475 [Firmicutes bacterium ADurb.Bin248]|nr:MAG: hypothetical protein BWY35_01475 [Firmicutes bacterium ADurb.Bin248]HOF99621.1 CopG family transcriptional regulator [Clostridia bacterium]HPK15283.1 CopG family transcriptional regulator [Clostridia bacterium]
MLEENSEKLTLNISVVDLGKIDYLVSQGYYGNRTDFLRSAVKRQLDGHEAALKRDFVEKNITIGIVRIGPHDLEKAGGLQDCVVLGMLIVAPDVTLEMMKRAYRRLTVYGKVKCSREIEDHYEL